MADSADKSDKMARLAEATLRLVAQFGDKGMGFSRLARAAGVSRAWIYKYWGTREELIAFATDHFGAAFTMQGNARPPAASAKEWLDGVTTDFAQLLERTRAHPLVLALYFRFRGSQTPIGKRIARVEAIQADREIAELRRLYGLSRADGARMAEIIGSIRMGLAHSWSVGELTAVSTAAQAASHFRAALEGLLRT
jgi:AcrR family transcriptional regulator